MGRSYYLVIGIRYLSRTNSEFALFEPKSEDPGVDVDRALRLHCSAIQVKLQEGDDFDGQAKRYVKELRAVTREETNVEPPSGPGPTTMNIVGMTLGGVLPNGRQFYNDCFASFGSSTAAEDVRKAIDKGASEILVEVTKWGAPDRT